VQFRGRCSYHYSLFWLFGAIFGSKTRVSSSNPSCCHGTGTDDRIILGRKLAPPPISEFSRQALRSSASQLHKQLASIKDQGWIRKQGSECRMLSPDQPGKQLLSVVCQTFDFQHPRGDRMKYSLALAILLFAIAQATPPRYVTKSDWSNPEFSECIIMQFGHFSCAQKLRTIGIMRCAVHRRGRSCKSLCSESK